MLTAFARCSPLKMSALRTLQPFQRLSPPSAATSWAGGRRRRTAAAVAAIVGDARRAAVAAAEQTRSKRVGERLLRGSSARKLFGVAGFVRGVERKHWPCQRTRHCVVRRDGSRFVRLAGIRLDRKRDCDRAAWRHRAANFLLDV